MDSVFVWKDEASYKEAMDLIIAKVHEKNPMMVMRLLSCMPKSGDTGVVTDGGFFSSTIIVTSGKNTGCRGIVANEDLAR